MPHQSTKGELTMLLRVAKALMFADSVEAAMRAIEHGTALRPDAVLIITNSDSDSGDSAYFLDTSREGACLELDHQLCRRLRESINGAAGLPSDAQTLDGGKLVVAPFDAEHSRGYIGLVWQAPLEHAVRRHALKLLPCVAELAGVRLTQLLEQLHREEEQGEILAATQSRHIEELRASEYGRMEACELAARDELTGLQNRRGFLAKSQQCLLIARRQELACAVIFADVDGLKLINDKFGHAAGDELIRDAAHVFNSAFRHADVVGRVGGDEFAAFTFDNATPRAIVERIKEKTAQFNIGRQDGFTLSLSIGVINCDMHGEDSLPDYLLRADIEMYRQKRRTKPSAH